MRVKLRPLEEKDENLILEWMENPSIIKSFRFKDHPLTKAQIHDFVLHSFTKENQHYAIVNNQDEYLGTVSLKNINLIPNTAEYAIVLRKSVQGLGVAKEATELVLQIAFEKLNLEMVYLNVLNDNKNAYKFYEKFGFTMDDDYALIRKASDQAYDLRYYSVKKQDFIQKNTEIIALNEKGDERGKLVIVESHRNIPFEIRRTFFMYGTEAKAERGMHANRRTEFMMITMKGSVTIEVDDGTHQSTYILNSPNQGLFLPRMVWKKMKDFSQDCILLVLASELYDADEYIRDYNKFIEEKKEQL